MLKKSILLIGIVIILFSSLIYARGGGVACPYYQTNNFIGEYFNKNHYVKGMYENAEFGFYSYDTNILLLKANSSLFRHLMVFEYTSLDTTIAKKEKLFSYWNNNQEDMNIYFLFFVQSKGHCRGYNFGKVTHHEKAIAGTHYY